ncbi:MAG: DUF488 domain-containing protein [Wenzhouxiangella sp.]
MTDAIRIGRIHDDQGESRGTRVLVDRVWPRGISKDEAALDHWYRDVAPSTELRKWFGHEPKRWATFKRKYRAELEADDKMERLEELAEMARSGPLVLLYGARDEEHNQAVVLCEVLEEMLQLRR